MIAHIHGHRVREHAVAEGTREWVRYRYWWSKNKKNIVTFRTHNSCYTESNIEWVTVIKPKWHTLYSVKRFENWKSARERGSVRFRFLETCETYQFLLSRMPKAQVIGGYGFNCLAHRNGTMRRINAGIWRQLFFLRNFNFAERKSHSRYQNKLQITNYYLMIDTPTKLNYVTVAVLCLYLNFLYCLGCFVTAAISRSPTSIIPFKMYFSDENSAFIGTWCGFE